MEGFITEHTEEITLTTALKACMERQEGEFRSSAVSSFVITRFDKDDKKEPYKKVSDRICDGARLNIQVADEYLRVDYEFELEGSATLKMLWKYMEEYGQLSNRIDGDDDPHFMTILIQPDKYFGKYSVGLTNPIFWAPIPVSISQERYTRLRMIFSLKNVELVIREYDKDTEDEERKADEDERQI